MDDNISPNYALLNKQIIKITVPVLQIREEGMVFYSVVHGNGKTYKLSCSEERVYSVLYSSFMGSSSALSLLSDCFLDEGWPVGVNSLIFH
jgi:hypothetical protein